MDRFLVGLEGFEPPDDESEFAVEAYCEGFRAAMSGLGGDACPYKPSGHERDTTFEDMKYGAWWSGYGDCPPSLMSKAEPDVVAIKAALAAMTPDQRLAFFAAITEDFCTGCGGDNPYCPCRKDE